MKQSINKILFTLLAVTLAFACRKEPSFDYAEGTVGSSRITSFPVFNFSGPTALALLKGETYTEPGVTAKEGESDLTVTTTGSVNTAQPGVYNLTYSATNKDGFSATTQRIVIVSPGAEQPGVDISGEYSAIGGAPGNATVTKIGKGVYHTTNCWGGGSTVVIPAYFFCLDGATVNIPLQDLGTGVGRMITETPGTYSAGLINWTPTRLDFPTGPLTVNKKWQKL